MNVKDCLWRLLSGSFLTRMRDYMPPSHKKLIQDISSQPSLRSFVQQQASERLNQAFHLCVTKLLALRSYHINVVSRFITVPAARARQLRNQNQDANGEMISRAPAALEERGTGGSGIMSFLKTVRDQTKEALLPETSGDIKHHSWCELSCLRLRSKVHQVSHIILPVNQLWSLYMLVFVSIKMMTFGRTSVQGLCCLSYM